MMKFKIRLKYFIPMISLLLVSCNSGSNNTSHSNTGNNDIPDKKYPIKDNNSSSIFTLGGTYDSMSNHPTNVTSCLLAESNPANMEIIQPQATLNFTSTSSSSAVKNALGVEFTAQVGWGPFSVGSSYSFANTSQDDDYTLNLNYIYQYAGQYVFKGGTLVQGNNALIPDAKKLVESGDWVGFRQMCGDEFIDQINAGVSVLMKLSLSFNSHAEKNTFDNSMVQAVGLNDVINQIEHNTSGIKYHLQVSGIQVGGNPDLLNQLFMKYSGKIGPDGYPILDCGSNSGISSNCVGMINEIITYATSVSNQLTDINSYYLYSPAPETWDQLGIFPGPANPDPSILQAMQDLSLQYVQDQYDLTFLNHYYPILESANLLSSDMNALLSQSITNYQQVLAVYTNPQNEIMNCYEGYVSIQCPSIRDNIFKQRSNILADPKLNDLLSYLRNNVYITPLWKTNQPELINSKAICTLMPISESSQNLFLVDCDSQVSGSLDPRSGTTIIYDAIRNTLNVNNLNYNYYLPSSGNLNFNYITPQPFTVDLAMPNTWNGDASVYIKGSYYDTSKLQIVKQY